MHGKDPSLRQRARAIDATDPARSIIRAVGTGLKTVQRHPRRSVRLHRRTTLVHRFLAIKGFSERRPIPLHVMRLAFPIRYR